MSAERKKLLWISISACVFVLVVLAAGFFLLTPKKGGEQAPATIGNSAPPKAQDPHDFLSTPPSVPGLEAPQPQQPQSKDGNVIIIYGDKPNSPVAPQGTIPAPGSVGEAGSSSGTADEGAAPAASPPPETKAPAPKPKASPAPKSPAKGAAAAAAKPAPKPAAAKVDQYWIQVGAFKGRSSADELKQALADKGIAALIVLADVGGKNYYRVRVGPYSLPAEADGWLGRIKDLPGCADAKVWKSTLKPKR